jgi:DNA-binding CsgD family transcriptional regulator
MPRGFGVSEVTREAIWELRAQGLSDREIGRRLGLPRGSVSNHLARTGGIRPRARRRPERCLSFEEREEVSRAIAGGHSARAIARALGRAHTTIAREINRWEHPRRQGWCSDRLRSHRKGALSPTAGYDCRYAAKGSSQVWRVPIQVLRRFPRSAADVKLLAFARAAER